MTESVFQDRPLGHLPRGCFTHVRYRAVFDIGFLISSHFLGELVALQLMLISTRDRDDVVTLNLVQE